VKEFVAEAFAYANLDWRDYVAVDGRYVRPTEVMLLQADAVEARRRLGWEPKVTFADLVKIMVDADLEIAGLPPIGEGLACLNNLQMTWLGRP
jgi:GDPmannose 4,6-dehydratase